MSFKKSLFGYSKKDVNEKLEAYQNLVDLQRRDIEFLKRDNAILKTTISQFADQDTK